MNKKTSYLCALALSFAGGVLVTFVAVDYYYISEHNEDEQIQIDNARLTNPYLECRSLGYRDDRLDSFKEITEEHIENYQDTHPEAHISVYARNLTTGLSRGINEDYEYIPASLSKLPMFIYLLSEIDANKIQMGEKHVFFAKDMFLEDNISIIDPNLSLIEGKVYSTEELLFRMIAYSDNYATSLLANSYNIAPLDPYLAHIGFTVVGEIDGAPQNTSPQNYSALFRILYNNTLLSREWSEYALSLLSENALMQGMRRYLDEDVVLASKYGFYGPGNSFVEEKQFHECGIVYIPGDPHLLCIMTRDVLDSPYPLIQLVEDISHEFYTIYGVAGEDTLQDKMIDFDTI